MQALFEDMFEDVSKHCLEIARSPDNSKIEDMSKICPSPDNSKIKREPTPDNSKIKREPTPDMLEDMFEDMSIT